MANVWYPKALEAMLQGDIALDTDVVKYVLIDLADYTYNAAHDFLNDVPAGARVGTPQTLGSKTFTDGTLDGADGAFSSVTGDPSEGLILFVDTGVEATSRLLIFIDTATGLPVTPNGGNINVTWNASGIGKI